MNNQQLEYIVAVDRYRHFVKAAEACNITQPTLSMMIQKLEEELGVSVFDRSKHPVEPTTIGEKIIQQARTILNEIGRIKELVNSETKMLSGNLKLAVIPTIAPYLIPSFILKFRAQFPQVTLSVSEMRTSSVIEQIIHSEIDMAILSTPLQHNEILEIPLYYEKFIAYFSPDNPHNHDILSADHLPLEQLWVLQEGHCIRNQIFNFCGKKITHNHIYEAGSIDTLIKIVDRNGGYSVIPELHLEFLDDERKKNTREITSPPAVREVSIVIKKDYIKEKMVNAVADTVKQIIPQTMLDERLKKFSIKL